MAKQDTKQPETVTDYPSQALQRFNPLEAELKQAAADYAGLTIAGPDDLQGYEVVQKAIARLVGLRTGIEKARVEIKAPALEFGRKVDKEAKRLTDFVLTAELDLKKEKARIDEIHADEERAKQRAEMELFQRRADKLFEVGFLFDGTDYIAGSLHILAAGLVGLTEKKFEECLVIGAKEIADEKARKIKESSGVQIQTNVLPDLPEESIDEGSGTVTPVVFADGPGLVYEPGNETSGELDLAAIFAAGFEDCQKKVLKILESPDKFTRDKLRELITSLKPGLYGK